MMRHNSTLLSLSLLLRRWLIWITVAHLNKASLKIVHLIDNVVGFFFSFLAFIEAPCPRSKKKKTIIKTKKCTEERRSFIILTRGASFHCHSKKIFFFPLFFCFLFLFLWMPTNSVKESFALFQKAFYFDTKAWTQRHFYKQIHMIWFFFFSGNFGHYKNNTSNILNEISSDETQDL